MRKGPLGIVTTSRMLVCSACARRASNAVLHQLPAAKNNLVVPFRAIVTASTGRQNQRTAVNEIGDNTGTLNQYNNRPKRQNAPAKIQRATKKELEWIHDPWHLAGNITKKLKDGEFEKALHMTREASSGDQVVVSWNHLIEYLFKQQKIHAALKLFNEMKKRAQLPNAQTYTIIFSGLAESEHPKLAVGEALKIYNAMLSSQRLKPNVAHLNAVLDVCAKAQDIESLFVTLRSATSERPPDNLTYTIILNALRYQQSNFVNPNSELPTKQENEAVSKSIAQTISRAKLVWEEVMARWQKNEIVMDEELMCTMGRVLLLGGPAETETILNMVTKLTGITKLKDGQPGLMPDASKKRVAKPGHSEKTEANEEVGGAKGSGPGKADALGQRNGPANASSKGQPLQQSIEPSVARFAANNTLSLLMRALANSRLTKLGARYWDYMTTIYGVRPDRKNYRDYLDCLFTGAASGKAARAIVSMPSEITESQAIRRALLICLFDSLNSQAFDNATVIIDAMTRKLRYPDPRCLRVYLDVATKARNRFSDETKYPTQQERDLGFGMQLFSAVDRIWEPLRLAMNHLGFSEGPMLAASPQEKSTRSYLQRRELISVAQTTQGICDKILSQRLLPPKSEESRITIGRREVLNKAATRWHQQTEHPGRA